MPDESDSVSLAIEEIKDTLKRLEARISVLEGGLTAPTMEKHKAFSVKEFVISKKPNNETKKTLAIGYFLEKHEAFESFNAHDLENEFRKAKEKVPLNINDKVNGNIRNGHMMQAPGLKDGLTAWTLTSSGERFVENNFQATG